MKTIRIEQGFQAHEDANSLRKLSSKSRRRIFRLLNKSVLVFSKNKKISWTFLDLQAKLKGKKISVSYFEINLDCT